MQSSNQGSDGPPTPKRRRTRNQQPVLSCQECRRMKWKCDRSFPCGNCEKRGIAFMCPSGKLDPKGKKLSTIASETLQKRIEELEAALFVTQSRLSTDTHPLLRYRGQSIEPPNTPGPPADSMHSDPLGLTTPVIRGELDTQTGHLTLGDQPGSSRYLGEAGPAYLYGDDYGELRSDNMLFSASKTTVEELCSRLPAWTQARHLSDVYFEIGAIRDNIVTRSTFDDHLDHVYHSNDIATPRGQGIDSQRLAIVFLVFSKAATMDVHLLPYNDHSVEYYRLGRAAISIDSSCSVSLVQALHLVSRCIGDGIGSGAEIPRYWGMLGFAARSAIQLGLHIDSERWNLSEKESEIRRRAFWEIHSEDVLQSMTQGRPRLVLDTVISAKFPAVNPNDLDDIFHHYKVSYRYMSIWSKVNDTQCRVTRTSYSEIIAIDKELRDFDRDLPTSLRWTEGNPRPSVVPRHDFQKLIMKLYLAEGLYFLHRAPFAQSLRDNAQEPLLSQMKFSYIAELDAARVLIEVLRDAQSIQEEIASRFHSFPFHAFNAIVTFAAAATVSPSSSLISAVLLHLDEGMETYSRIRSEFNSSRYKPILQRMHQAAHRSFNSFTGATAGPNEEEESLAYFNSKTTLKRVPPKVQSSDPDLSTVLADAVAQQTEASGRDFTFDPTIQSLWAEGDFGGLFNSQLEELDNCKLVVKGKVVLSLIPVGDDFSWFTADFH